MFNLTSLWRRPQRRRLGDEARPALGWDFRRMKNIKSYLEFRCWREGGVLGDTNFRRAIGGWGKVLEMMALEPWVGAHVAAQEGAMCLSHCHLAQPLHRERWQCRNRGGPVSLGTARDLRAKNWNRCPCPLQLKATWKSFQFGDIINFPSSSSLLLLFRRVLFNCLLTVWWKTELMRP